MRSFAIAHGVRRNARTQAPPVAALDYSIDVAARLVTITGQIATVEEWKDLLVRILQDPQLQPGFAFLRDRRGAIASTDVGTTVVAIVDATRRFWPHIQPSRAAILVSRKSDAGAAAAHALAEAHGFCVKAFTSYEEAIAWLRQGFET